MRQITKYHVQLYIERMTAETRRNLAMTHCNGHRLKRRRMEQHASHKAIL